VDPDASPKFGSHKSGSRSQTRQGVGYLGFGIRKYGKKDGGVGIVRRQVNAGQGGEANSRIFDVALNQLSQLLLDLIGDTRTSRTARP
jgi:hypothetical protein